VGLGAVRYCLYWKWRQHCISVAVSLIRFKEGLKTLGVLDCMVQHPDSMRRAFVHSSQKLDATIVEEVFVIPKLSEMGSNRYRMEKMTIAFWRDYLQDLEGSCNFYVIAYLVYLPKINDRLPYQDSSLLMRPVVLT